MPQCSHQCPGHVLRAGPRGGGQDAALLSVRTSDLASLVGGSPWWVPFTREDLVSTHLVLLPPQPVHGFNAAGS